MKKADIPVVKRSLFSWVFADNVKLQLSLLLIIAVMVAARVLPLEMQKRIINEAINLRNIDLLFRYCGIYLASVVFFSALKYLTNVIQTFITQRTTAKMRKELYHHILTLPLAFLETRSRARWSIHSLESWQHRAISSAWRFPVRCPMC